MGSLDLMSLVQSNFSSDTVVAVSFHLRLFSSNIVSKPFYLSVIYLIFLRFFLAFMRSVLRSEQNARMGSDYKVFSCGFR